MGVEHLGQFAFMLKAMCAGPEGFLYLVSHPQLPETFLQQGQGMVALLMTCISVAPIQSSSMVCLGNHKEREIFSFVFGALSTGTRPPDESQNSVNSVRSVYLLHWRHDLAKASLRFVCFCAFSQSSTALNIRSSLWALAQLVTCSSTNGSSTVTCTSFFKHWSPSTTAGLCTSA